MSPMTKYAAGGVIRKGKIPNPTLGIFVNPRKRRKKNRWGVGNSKRDKLGPQMAAYYRHETDLGKELWYLRDDGLTKSGKTTKLSKAQIIRLKKEKDLPLSVADERFLAKKGSQKRTKNGERTMAKKRRRRNRRRKHNERSTHKRVYKGRGRKQKKSYALRRRNPTGYMPDNLSETLKPVFAGVVGFAAPGIIEALTRNAISTRLQGYFAGERVAQKAQAALSVGSFAMFWYASKKVDIAEKYRNELLMGSGIRAMKDLMDAFLGTEPNSLSQNIRGMLGLTGSMATAPPNPGTVPLIPASAAGSATGAYYLDAPMHGDRSFLDGDRSYDEIGDYYLDTPELSAWSDTEISEELYGDNPFEEPF